MIANEIATAFRREGALVVGMAPTTEKALLMLSQVGPVDGAIVDITLRDQAAFPVIQALKRRGIPFILATALDEQQIPSELRDVPRLSKPFSSAELVKFYIDNIGKSGNGHIAGAIRSPARPHASRLLQNLTHELAGALTPHLTGVDLQNRMRLEMQGGEIAKCYFLESGFASHIVRVRTGEHIEVALTGSEGLVGLPVLLGGQYSLFDTVMRSAGRAQEISASKLTEILRKHRSLGDALRQPALELMSQMGMSVLSSNHFRIEARVARWLLLASERIGNEEVPFSHGAIASALGVRRPGVTQALQKLKATKSITASRGSVTIINRARLIDTSRGCYVPADV